jgi:hypothetical protein
MGRRVYLEVVVLLASAFAEVAMQSGVPKQTVRRWRSWWSEVGPRDPAWLETRARFAPPPPADHDLPASLLDRLADELGEQPELILDRAARMLAPMTTRSLSDSSRFAWLV